MLIPVVKNCLNSFLLFYICLSCLMKLCLVHPHRLFFSFPHLEGLSLYSRLRLNEVVTRKAYVAITEE